MNCVMLVSSSVPRMQLMKANAMITKSKKAKSDLGLQDAALFDTFLKVSCIIALSSISAIQLYNGPYKSWSRNSTVFRENIVNIDGTKYHLYVGKILKSNFSITAVDQTIELPEIIICKSPFIKNFTNWRAFREKSNLKGFKSFEEQQKMKEESIFTKPEEFVKAINIAPNYETLLDEDKIHRMPVGPPYTRMILSDLETVGFCVAISFKAMRQYIIDLGYADESEIDFDYYVLVQINVGYSKYLLLTFMIFAIFVSFYRETTMSQETMMTEPSSSLKCTMKMLLLVLKP